jgi:hypothetical protein
MTEPDEPDESVEPDDEAREAEREHDGTGEHETDEDDKNDEDHENDENEEPSPIEEAAGERLGVEQWDRPLIFRDAADAAVDNALPYWLVLALSGAIATLGLALDSSAVVIGAMSGRSWGSRWRWPSGTRGWRCRASWSWVAAWSW